MKKQEGALSPIAAIAVTLLFVLVFTPMVLEVCLHFSAFELLCSALILAAAISIL